MGHSLIQEVLALVEIGFILAAPFIAIALHRRSLLGAPGSIVDAARFSTPVLVAASLAAGLIHAAVIEEHLAESVLFGSFFVASAIFQIGWAWLYLRSSSRGLATAALVVNTVIIAVWLVSRTTGLPFGPAPWVAESIGVPDIFATLFQVLLVAGTLAVTVRRWRGEALRPRWTVASADLAMVLILVVITMTTSYSLMDISLNGAHAEQDEADHAASTMVVTR